MNIYDYVVCYVVLVIYFKGGLLLLYFFSFFFFRGKNKHAHLIFCTVILVQTSKS